MALQRFHYQLQKKAVEDWKRQYEQHPDKLALIEEMLATRMSKGIWDPEVEEGAVKAELIRAAWGMGSNQTEKHEWAEKVRNYVAERSIKQIISELDGFEYVQGRAEKRQQMFNSSDANEQAREFLRSRNDELDRYRSKDAVERERALREEAEQKELEIQQRQRAEAERLQREEMKRQIEEISRRQVEEFQRLRTQALRRKNLMPSAAVQMQAQISGEGLNAAQRRKQRREQDRLRLMALRNEQFDRIRLLQQRNGEQKDGEEKKE